MPVILDKRFKYKLGNTPIVRLYRGTMWAEGCACRIGMIRMPEIIGNLCFGGTKGNRLFMAGSTSLYAVFVATRGGTLT